MEDWNNSYGLLGKDNQKNVWTEEEKAQMALDWEAVYTEQEPVWDAAAAALLPVRPTS